MNTKFNYRYLKLLFLMCFLSNGVLGKQYELSNTNIARILTVDKNTLVTTSFTNKHCAEQMNTSGKEFAIYLDDAKEPVTALNSKVIDIQQHTIKGKNTFVFILRNSRLEQATLKVVYELDPTSFFGRKWIEIIPAKDQVIKVAKIEVEHLNVKDDVVCTSQGYGQPIYLNDMFMGLEWPVAQNNYKNQQLVCSHLPGYNISEPYKSQTAVWGAAPKGLVRQWFLGEYVDSIRKTPVRPVVLYNSWYDIRELNKPVLAEYLNTIETFRERLEKDQKIKVDYIVPDDGWQNRNSIYQPEDGETQLKLRDLVEEKLDKAKLGIWMPVHGCRAFDMNWARDNGYAVAIPKLWGSSTMCLSMPKYRAELERRLKEIIVDQRILYFKHDNNNLSCPNADHGHRPSSDSQVEEMFEIMDYMKSLNPNVYLNYTTGMNMSPWWLKGCDCIWMGGGDVGSAGIGNKREQAISYRDTRMRQNEKYQFPMNSLMTHGIIKGRYMMGFQNESLDHWKNYVWMFVSRGVSMFELYLSPDYLTSKEWDFLGKTLRWTLDHSDILFNNTNFILGDVRKNEPYGYAHTKDDEAIVFLRNPSNNLTFDEEHSLKLKQWKRKYADKAFKPEVTAAQFDDSSWENVTIGDVDLTDAKHIAYRTKFRAHKVWKGKKVRIHFEGVDEHSVIFLNGKKIGEHSGCVGVIDPQTGEEMLNNWHYSYKGYYKYNASGFYMDVDANDLQDENTLTVTLNNTGKVGGMYGGVSIRPILNEQTTKVKFKLDPQELGIDPKFKTVTLDWVHAQSQRKVKKAKMGETIELDFEAFEVNVLKMKLE
ncbi:hypothetical protein EYV94_19920 [Puteibacter caeruleilacunae]|nr:hypothetical protein EYV94_19920 [Puteibacter caeruleilacunae]